jgi:Tfp pilus assembly protein PilV
MCVCITMLIMANRPEALAHIHRPAAALETPETTALAVLWKAVLMIMRIMRKRDVNNVRVDNDWKQNQPSGSTSACMGALGNRDRAQLDWYESLKTSEMAHELVSHGMYYCSNKSLSVAEPTTAAQEHA